MPEAYYKLRFNGSDNALDKAKWMSIFRVCNMSGANNCFYWVIFYQKLVLSTQGIRLLVDFYLKYELRYKLSLV